MEEDETKEGIILKNIKSNRIVGKLSSKTDEGIFTYKELPPYVEFDDKRDSTYKYLGTIRTTRGENVHKYSVRKRKNRKKKHFTLVWNGIVKNENIQDIKDENEIRNPETIKQYKMVTCHIRLPKTAVKNLRDEYNEFLYPKPYRTDTHTELFEIFKQPYALDLIKLFSEKEEITRAEFKNATGVKESKSFKYLDSFEQLGLLRSYKYGSSGIKIYRVTLEKERIAKIMNILSD